MFIGTCSFVFGIDLSQAIDQMKTDIFSMGDLFESKVVVSNIYFKALKLAKDREVGATTSSLDYLATKYAGCSRATTNDFINVLYNSNFSFRETFEQILPPGTKKPISSEIDKSYAVFLACKGLNSDINNIKFINTEVNRAYYEGYSNAYSLAAINQDNYGSDLFWNGTLDDSSFDILYDINKVGDILFEEFKESPQILFYRMPTAQSVTTRGGGGLSSLSDQSSFQVGGGGSYASTTGSPSSSTSSLSSSGSLGGGTFGSSQIQQTLSLSSSTSNGEEIVPTVDQEIKNFITTTNTTTPSLPGGSALVFGNQCLSGVESKAPIYTEEQPKLATDEEYIAAITDFIDNASINDVINENLLEQFKVESPLPPGGSTSAPGVADQIANTYAEQAFGDAQPGTCEYNCNNKPLDEQVQCQFHCAKSCIEQCKDISGIQQKALCISDCTCFLVAGPNGAGREKIEDMFRIKFCKVPSETKKVIPGKKVYSIQAIFQEILDVLEGLKDSGEMIKFSKTKEFLDGTIKIKFADNFAFKLQVGFKPTFPQRSTTLKIQDATQTNKELNLGILNMNTSAPEADDYNKYIIISDPAKNKANLEEATSLNDVEANIQKFQDAAVSYTQVSDQTAAIMRKTSAHDLNIIFMQNIINFIQDNYSFWDNFAQSLLDMTKMSLELKARIEASK